MLDDSISPVQREYRLIHDIYLFFSALDRKLLMGFDLTPTQFSVMLLLDRADGIQLVTLSERAFVARSTITRVVDQLVATGLVKRVSHANDRRAQCAFLTDDGCALRDRIIDEQTRLLEEQLGVLSSAEHNQLVALLQKMRNGLEPVSGN